MSIAWTPDLAVNDPKIDRQHKELFGRVAALQNAIADERDAGYVAELVDFLERYMVEHFEAEERLMAQARYPQFAEHRAEHVRFVDEWCQLKSTFETDGPSRSFAMGLDRFVVAWLRNHISVRDKAVGRFLAARAKAA